MSADPAVSDYIPMAPVDDEAKKHNEQLPGMGGVFNVVNFQLYHYAGNNPVKYTDPDGKIQIPAEAQYLMNSTDDMYKIALIWRRAIFNWKYGLCNCLWF